MSVDLNENIEAGKLRLLGRLYRIVESQEEVATHTLVDNLKKQEVLERLLEQSKPTRLAGSEKLHYLLATPFRYPPLPWGSRFGAVAANGIFYGSKTVTTLLAEAAYYRLIFFHAMDPPPATPVTSYHNIFSAKYHANPGIRLQDPRWQKYWGKLTDPGNYGFCQSLGLQLRRAQVSGLEVPAARALQAGLVDLPPGNSEGINVALFEPSALLKKPPTQIADVTAESHSSSVSFLLRLDEQIMTQNFTLEMFQVDGILPHPA